MKEKRGTRQDKTKQDTELSLPSVPLRLPGHIMQSKLHGAVILILFFHYDLKYMYRWNGDKERMDGPCERETEKGGRGFFVFAILGMLRIG